MYILYFASAIKRMSANDVRDFINKLHLLKKEVAIQLNT